MAGRSSKGTAASPSLAAEGTATGRTLGASRMPVAAGSRLAFAAVGIAGEAFVSTAVGEASASSTAAGEAFAGTAAGEASAGSSV